MKYRSDFVTNSSSSSFILCFDTKDSISKFKEECQNWDYGDFYSLVERCLSDILCIFNETDDVMELNPILDLIEKKDLPECIIEKIDEVYIKEVTLKPRSRFDIVLYNPFVEDKPIDYDVSALNFDDIDADEYYVYFSDGSENRDKAVAIEHLSHWKSVDFGREFTAKHVQKRESESYNEFISRQITFSESKEYKEAVEKFLETTDISVRSNRINSAELIANIVIWDSEGGLLEWAIRNGFIRSEFRNYLIFQMDVG